jgi:hypothetical protein
MSARGDPSLPGRASVTSRATASWHANDLDPNRLGVAVYLTEQEDRGGPRHVHCLGPVRLRPSGYSNRPRAGTPEHRPRCTSSSRGHADTGKLARRASGSSAASGLLGGDVCTFAHSGSAQTFCKRNGGHWGIPVDTNGPSRSGKPQVDRTGGYCGTPEDTYEVGLIIRRSEVQVLPAPRRKPQVRLAANARPRADARANSPLPAH